MGFIQGPLFFTMHAFITFICPLIFAVIVARAKPRREWNLRPELTPFQRFHKVQTFGRHYDILIFSGCRRRSVRPCTAEGQGDEQGYRCYTDAIQHVTEFYSCQKVTICHRLRSSKLCIQTVEWKKHMQKKKARVSLTAQVLHICQGSKCQGSKYIVANQLEIILHLAATNFSTKTFQSRR